MDPQTLETPHHEKLFIGIIVGLLLGGAGGYYAGWLMGQAQGIESATQTMQEQMPTAPVQTHAQVQDNPLQNAQTNPLDGVKTNPFE